MIGRSTVNRLSKSRSESPCRCSPGGCSLKRSMTLTKRILRSGNSARSIAVAASASRVGTYKSSRPDVLRIFVGETDEPAYDHEVEVVEADIDDMEMEYMGAVADRLRAAGALDVLFFPVSMKKGRVGIRLSVTTGMDTFEKIVDMIFTETTTFGMRFHRHMRRVLRREEETIETSFGPVRIKKGFDLSGRLIKTHIEFDDVRSIADARSIPYREVLELVRKEIETRIKTVSGSRFQVSG